MKYLKNVLMLMVLNTIQAPAKVDQQFEQPLCKTIGVPLECVRDQSVVLDLAKKYISEIPTESLWQEYLTLGALDKANPARTFGHALSSHQFDIPLTESQLSTVLLIFSAQMGSTNGGFEWVFPVHDTPANRSAMMDKLKYAIKAVLVGGGV